MRAFGRKITKLKISKFFWLKLEIMGAFIKCDAPIFFRAQSCTRTHDIERIASGIRKTPAVLITVTVIGLPQSVRFFACSVF